MSWVVLIIRSRGDIPRRSHPVIATDGLAGKLAKAPTSSAGNEPASDHSGVMMTRRRNEQHTGRSLGSVPNDAVATILWLPCADQQRRKAPARSGPSEI